MANTSYNTLSYKVFQSRDLSKLNFSVLCICICLSMNWLDVSSVKDCKISLILNSVIVCHSVKWIFHIQCYQHRSLSPALVCNISNSLHKLGGEGWPFILFKLNWCLSYVSSNIETSHHETWCLSHVSCLSHYFKQFDTYLSRQ